MPITPFMETENQENAQADLPDDRTCLEKPPDGRHPEIAEGIQHVEGEEKIEKEDKENADKAPVPVFLALGKKQSQSTCRQSKDARTRNKRQTFGEKVLDRSRLVIMNDARRRRS